MMQFKLTLKKEALLKKARKEKQILLKKVKKLVNSVGVEYSFAQSKISSLAAKGKIKLGFAKKKISIKGSLTKK